MASLEVAVGLRKLRRYVDILVVEIVERVICFTQSKPDSWLW